MLKGHLFSICTVVYLFIQFDTNNHSTLMTWLPRKLAPKVRVILSMIPETPPHLNLMKRETKPIIVMVPPLSLSVRKVYKFDITCQNQDFEIRC